MPNKYNIRAKRQVLDDLLRKRAWLSFRSNFDHTLEDARAIVEYHNNTLHRTLLHSLCNISHSSSRPPPDLLYIVAESSPRSLLLQDSGQTPLHLCITREYSLEAISALFSLVAKIDSLNKQHLLLSVDSHGRTPLLAAVCRFDNNINEQVVRYLVNQDVDGTSLLPTSSGGARNKQKHHFAPLKYVASSESISVGEGLEGPEDLLRFMLVKTYLARMKELYHEQGETYIDWNESNVCLLQAAILCFDLFGSSRTASSILSCIIRNQLYQVERLHSRTDAAGNLTIHVTCISNADHSNQVLKLYSHETECDIDDCTLIEYVLKSSHPNSLLCRNKDRDIPLHCALRSKRNWTDVQQLIDSCPSSVSIFTGKGELPLHVSIKYGHSSDYVLKLWELYPEAASVIDSSTGLYPFQLAAIIPGKLQRTPKKSKRKVTSKSIEDWDALSVSYFFLRECPSVMKFKHQ